MFKKHSAKSLKSSATCLCYNIAHAVPISHETSAIEQIFYELLVFCDLFHEPLGGWETSKIFANIKWGFCVTTSLS